MNVQDEKRAIAEEIVRVLSLGFARQIAAGLLGVGRLQRDCAGGPVR